MQSSFRFMSIIFYGFLILKASTCVLVFPHIVCIYLYRSVYRLHSLLRFFRFRALRIHGVRRISLSNSIWLLHHGPCCCYSEFLVQTCALVSGMVIRNAFLASRTCLIFLLSIWIFILYRFSNFSFFYEKYLLHMYIKI